MTSKHRLQHESQAISIILDVCSAYELHHLSETHFFVLIKKKGGLQKSRSEMGQTVAFCSFGLLPAYPGPWIATLAKNIAQA